MAACEVLVRDSVRAHTRPGSCYLRSRSSRGESSRVDPVREELDRRLQADRSARSRGTLAAAAGAMDSRKRTRDMIAATSPHTFLDLDRAVRAASGAVHCRPDGSSADNAEESERALGASTMSVQYQAVGWNRQKRIYDSVLARWHRSRIWRYSWALGRVALSDRHCGNAADSRLRDAGAASAARDSVHRPALPAGSSISSAALQSAPPGRDDVSGGAGARRVLDHPVSRAGGCFAAGQPVRQQHALRQSGEFSVSGTGVLALLILFVMAATSHDFWLHNLSAPVWKRIHMLVYLAYALLVAHVVLGALQSDTQCRSGGAARSRHRAGSCASSSGGRQGEARRSPDGAAAEGRLRRSLPRRQHSGKAREGRLAWRRARRGLSL